MKDVQTNEPLIALAAHTSYQDDESGMATLDRCQTIPSQRSPRHQGQLIRPNIRKRKTKNKVLIRERQHTRDPRSMPSRVVKLGRDEATSAAICSEVRFRHNGFPDKRSSSRVPSAKEGSNVSRFGRALWDMSQTDNEG
uniref:Uncharacterized protein n=1 Tax=Spongospora subterranea TaxID=70186 RepID=A0A0H5QMH3_9EUKA|eukprot:CRZ03330.1 hypothetical protein [Spongospora subterranea]